MLYFLQLRVFIVWFSAILEYFQYCTFRCGLAKTITAPHLIFAIKYAVQCTRCNLVSFELVYFSRCPANYQCGVHLHVRGRKHASNAYCIFSNQEYSQCNSAQFWTIFSIALSGVVWTKPSPHQTSFLQSHMRCDAVYKLQFGRF